MLKDGRLRVVTYNVHKCIGLDRRERPGRIAAVLREVDADVVALQEVVSVESDSSREAHQARYIAEELDFQFHLGENRKHRGGAYGNVVLTRLPVADCHNYDITWRHQEPRGALRVDVQLDDAGAEVVHLFNIHLGTAFVERRHQGRKLCSESVLRDPKLVGPRVVLGDHVYYDHALELERLTLHRSRLSLVASDHLPLVADFKLIREP
jgi:endonuclease/exonuclease/phosphatase family metal-dependent hydrolase